MLEPGWHPGPTGSLSGTGPREEQPAVRQRVVAHALVAIAAFVIVLAAPLPFVPGPFGSMCAEAAAGPSAAVVVDFGDVDGNDASPLASCVPLSNRTTGAEALVAAGYRLRIENGLVCAINGYPANGCGERIGQRQYLYWSYWRADAGTNAWTYSSIGPGGARVADRDVEGWRFVDGIGSPNDPQPRLAPDHLAVCGPPHSADEPIPAPGNAPNATDAQVPPPVASESTVTTPPVAPVDASIPEVTTTANPGTTIEDRTEEALDDVAPASSNTDAGRAVGAIVVAAVIVALSVLAVVRSRRRVQTG